MKKIPSIEQMLALNNEVRGSDGIPMTGKQYLEDAARVSKVNRYDYQTTHYIIAKSLEGHDPDKIIERVQLFWEDLIKTYGQ